MRMRPAAQATDLNIKVLLDIESTSTVGSLYIDSVILRAIRPHMDWVNGSIADTAVSTGGRSFNWGTAYGQSSSQTSSKMVCREPGATSTNPT